MKYEDFITYVKTKVQQQTGAAVQVEVRRITKNNGVEMVGLSIGEVSRISPVIYLEDCYASYEHGVTMPEIIAEIMRMYEKARVKMPFDAEFYTKFDNVRDRIACKVVNYQKNAKLLKSIPHVKCMDLAIVFYYLVENSEIGDGTILIHNSHLEMWQQTKQYIYELARKNTVKLLPYQFQRMADIIAEITDEEYGEEDSLPMYVLSNEKKYLGAVTILYDSILAHIGRCLQEDFYILPSSVHEVIIVPSAIEVKAKELRAMVKEINETQVAPEEVLSNEVYFYEREGHRLSLIKFDENTFA